MGCGPEGDPIAVSSEESSESPSMKKARGIEALVDEMLSRQAPPQPIFIDLRGIPGAGAVVLSGPSSGPPSETLPQSASSIEKLTEVAFSRLSAHLPDHIAGMRFRVFLSSSLSGFAKGCFAEREIKLLGTPNLIADGEIESFVRCVLIRSGLWNDKT